MAHTQTHTTHTTEESKYLRGNCSRRTLQLCHLAAPNHCPLRLAMEAGSTCLCLLCHPSAQDCQFHSHASLTCMGSCPKMPKLKAYVYVWVYACVCTSAPPEYNSGAASLAHDNMWGPTRILLTSVKRRCVHKHTWKHTRVYTDTHSEASACVHRRTHAHMQTYKHPHAHISVHGAPANDGWQYDVCVRSKRIGITTWAKSAANSSRLLTKLFLCLLFSCFFLERRQAINGLPMGDQ